MKFTYPVREELLKKKAANPAPSKQAYLRSSIIYCGLCGAHMYRYSSRKLKNEEPMLYYNCNSRAKLDHLIKKIFNYTKKENEKNLWDSVLFVKN